MSQTPDNRPEAGHEHLRRAVRELPVHEPAVATWEQIAAQLAADDAVSRAVPHLPAHEPDEDLWDVIAARLDEAAPLALTPVTAEAPAVSGADATGRAWQASRAVRWLSGIAAAMLILMMVWWQRPRNTDKPGKPVALETTSYTEEVVTAPARAFDPLASQGVAFIDAHCTSLPTVCRTNEFRELRAQLAELEAEEQRVQRDVRRLGARPELVRHQVEVTTQKAAVTRELIGLLIS